MELDPRNTLENYVRHGKVMQLATVREDGSPWLCHVWYAPRFEPDFLYFTSRPTRNHSQHIASRPSVAGAILAMDLKELGQPVQGVVFTGVASLLKGRDLEEGRTTFVDRWRHAEDALPVEGLKQGTVPNALYRVDVKQWVLHDEINHASGPRQVLEAK